MPVFLLFLHGFAAAAGDHFPSFNRKGFMANGAVNIAILFCSHHRQQTFFQFHKIFLSKTGQEKILPCLFLKFRLYRLAVIRIGAAFFAAKHLAFRDLTQKQHMAA